jgi:hypothetical protein
MPRRIQSHPDDRDSLIRTRKGMMTRDEWERLIDRAVQRSNARGDELEVLRQEIESLKQEHALLLRIIDELVRRMK